MAELLDDSRDANCLELARWLERQDAMMARVAAAVRGECLVVYDAYRYDDENLPVDNLDEIAVHGRCKLIDYFGEVCYVSDVVENPTWLQVAVLANDMIHAAGETDHVFLEGIDPRGWEDGVAVYEFSMGS